MFVPSTVLGLSLHLPLTEGLPTSMAPFPQWTPMTRYAALASQVVGADGTISTAVGQLLSLADVVSLALGGTDLLVFLPLPQ